MTVHRDIAECRRAEQALQESQELLQDYLENANDMIQSMTPEGRLLYVNRRWRETLGYGEIDLDHLAAEEIVHPDSLAAFQSSLQLAAGGDSVENLSLVLIARDGHSIFVAGNMRPRFEGGRVVALRAIFSDVTKHKRAEDALMRASEEVARSVTDLKERTREVTLLSDMGDLLQSCLQADEAYRVVSYFMPRILPSVAGALCVANPSLAVFETVTSWGNLSGAERMFRLEDCWGLRRGHVHFVEDQESVLRCRHLGTARPVQYLCAPLTAHGEVLGVLHLQPNLASADTDAARGYLPHSAQRLAVTIADRISLALASLKLHEALRQQTIRDPLTSLFNRRYMQESLERELRRAVRSKRPLGILMLDIDHFKNFNDSFGHHSGDIMLREFSKLLTIHVRGEDIICRYGGEEFVLILPEASVEATRLRAEQLRKATALLRLASHGESLEGVTISVGVAGFPDHGDTMESLMRAVDQALYRAKAEGRDRVEVARGPKDRPTIVHLPNSNL
ncbi:MAG TPA: diguanylate cyclase [Acidobacteriota bacterium]|nr:diguanylate cyclase [Acidobacteriota bacterium]